MKDIPTDELPAISLELYEAAKRVGCTQVSITGQIWPGGRLGGSAEAAARFVEFSWLRAAVINGQAIFEESDPKAYSALLNRYGLGDEPYAEPVFDLPEFVVTPVMGAATLPQTVQLSAKVLVATKQELDRQASAAGLSVGEFLDWKFPEWTGHLPEGS